jgi:DNA-binding LytR/AlgR family response regulator
MNCIAIDDEPLALDIIKRFCSELRFINMIGTYTNPLDSIKVLNDVEIDLIFLDIEMPNITGFNFLKSLSTVPLIIITTAFPEHALQGFEVSAVDYLLKPFSFERFVKAVTKAFELNSLRKGTSHYGTHDSEFLLVRVDYNTVKIDINNILYIEGLKDYVKIYCSSRPILTKSTLKNFEAKLPSDNFIRVHKSFIVSLSKVKSIENNRIIIGEARIPIGDQFKCQFYEKLKVRMI